MIRHNLTNHKPYKQMFMIKVKDQGKMRSMLYACWDEFPHPAPSIARIDPGSAITLIRIKGLLKTNVVLAGIFSVGIMCTS